MSVWSPELPINLKQRAAVESTKTKQIENKIDQIEKKSIESCNNNLTKKSWPGYGYVGYRAFVLSELPQ